MRILTPALALFVVGAVALDSAALAQAPTDRFQIEETEGGVLRLDRVTGAVDHCALGDGGWACESIVEPAAPPERDVSGTSAWRDLEAENARLSAEVARLERRLAMIAALVAGIEPDAQAAADDLSVDDARRDIDRAVDVTGHAIRSFRSLIETLSEEEAAR